MPNRSPRLYYVYVIEVLPRTPARRGRRGTVYVGQTAHDPRYRFHQHRCGKRYCRHCTWRRYVPEGSGVRLRHDLAPRSPALTREHAERTERRVASSLRRRGYHVLGGH